MSIMRCDGCERNIDTDLKPMFHYDCGEDGSADYCEACDEKLSTMFDADEVSDIVHFKRRFVKTCG